MARSLTESAARRLRLASQRLGPRLPAGSGAAEVCAAALGLQAQQPTAFPLGVRVRSRGLRLADLDRARVQERSVIRTWCMRGTVHLLATEDVSWLVPLVAAPRLPGAHRRLAELGLPASRLEAALAAVDRALAGEESLSRDELVSAVRRRVRGVPASAQLGYWIGEAAAFHGIAAVGWEERGRTRFVRLADWAGVRLREPDETALSELARRYLAAYGPARPQDLAYWSGLPVGRARAGWKAIARELDEVDIVGDRMWRLRRGSARAARSGQPVVSLLPAFDTYLLGYRGRDLARAPEHEKRILFGGGMVNPVVAVDGWAVGDWRLTRRSQQVLITVTPWAVLAPGMAERLDAEAQDISRFLGVSAELLLGAPR